MGITILPVHTGTARSSIVHLLETAISEIGREDTRAKSAPRPALAAPAEPSPRGGLAPWQVSRVKTYIEANIADTLPVNRLSALVRLSAGHFSRAFRCSVGEAPHAYVVRRRLARARTLMLTSNAPLSDVALACGFADQAHLCKKFRKASDTSPAAWRRAQAGRTEDRAAA